MIFLRVKILLKVEGLLNFIVGVLKVFRVIKVILLWLLRVGKGLFKIMVLVVILVILIVLGLVLVFVLIMVC